MKKFDIDSLNIIGCDLVYGYNTITNEIEVDEDFILSKNKDIIILPYEEDLVSFTEALSIYKYYIYRTTGVSLYYPKRGVSRYLKDEGYYYDFKNFQEKIAKRRLLRWCYKNSIYNVSVN